jgi:chaperonin cofactor prefoldin
MKDEHIQYLILRIQALEKYNNELQEQIKQLKSKIQDAELMQ